MSLQAHSWIFVGKYFLVDELSLLATRGQSLKSKLAIFHPAIKDSLEAKVKVYFLPLFWGKKTALFLTYLSLGLDILKFLG